MKSKSTGWQSSAFFAGVRSQLKINGTYSVLSLSSGQREKNFIVIATKSGATRRVNKISDMKSPPPITF